MKFYYQKYYSLDETMRKVDSLLQDVQKQHQLLQNIQVHVISETN